MDGSEGTRLRENFQKISIFLLGAGVCLLNGSAHAVQNLSPNWSESSHSVSPNESYLENRSLRPSELEASGDPVLDQKSQKRLQQEYQDLTRAYETKENYSTATVEDRRTLTERVSDFSLYIVRTIVSYQISEGVSRAEKNSADVRAFKGVHEAVGAVAKGNVNVVNSDSEGGGGSTQEEPSFRFKMGTSTNLPRQSGQLWMESSLVNGTFDVTVGDSWGFDPWSLESLSDETRERYKVRLYRTLPVWGLQSDLTYGTTSKNMTASLSKQLSEHLRCELGATQSLENASLFSGGVEETVRLNYGVRF